MNGFDIMPANNLNDDTTMTITVIDVVTGTWATTQITIKKDLRTETRTTTRPQG